MLPLETPRFSSSGSADFLGISVNLMGFWGGGWGGHCSEQAPEKVVVGCIYESLCSLTISGVVHRDGRPKSTCVKAEEMLSGMKMGTECVTCKGPLRALAWRGGRECNRIYSLALKTHSVLHSPHIPIAPPPPPPLISVSSSQCLQLRNRKTGRKPQEASFLTFATVLPAPKAAPVLGWQCVGGRGSRPLPGPDGGGRAARGRRPTLPALGSRGSRVSAEHT